MPPSWTHRWSPAAGSDLEIPADEARAALRALGRAEREALEKLDDGFRLAPLAAQGAGAQEEVDRAGAGTGAGSSS